MENRFKSSVDYLIKKRRIYTASDLAVVLGKQKSYISELLSGKRTMSEQFILDYTKHFPEISRRWLLLGEEPMQNSVYDRIDSVLIEKNLSEREFAKGTGDLGFLFPKIYENAKKRNPADIKIAMQWVDSLRDLFPQYSREWLLYGTGDKFDSKDVSPNQIFSGVTDRPLDQQDVPLYDYNATAGLVAIFNDHTLEPTDYLKIPNLPPVDGAIYVRGESMSPLLKSGDIVMYKKKELSLDSILWGEIYLLSFMTDGDSYTAVKYIQKSDQVDKVRLVSFNPTFAPKDIPMSSITALALVKASLTFHTME